MGVEIRIGRVAARIVLICEDDIAVANLAEHAVKAAGHEAIVTHDAESALRRVADGAAVDVLLTDYELGSAIDGVDLIRAARRLRPGLRSILVSGVVDAAATAGLEAEFVPKPVSLVRLYAALERLFGGSDPVPPRA